jgi:hypothetical protein
MIAELLCRAAGEDLERRMVAGLVAISEDWCWDRFLLLRQHPQFGWAIDTLAAHVVEGDGAPEVLRKRAKELAAARASSDVRTEDA